MLLFLSRCTLFLLCRLFCVLYAEESEKIHFTDSWAVHIENGNKEIASGIADKHGFVNFGQIGSLPGYFHFVRKTVEGRRKRREVDHTATLLSEEKIKWVEQQRILERDKRSLIPDYIQSVHSTAYSIQDPLYNDQWYLNNVGQSSGPSGLDINVLPVWARGISGKGVVVCILDDGLDHTHPDLKRNYDPRASYDFNDYDEDPMPKSSDPSNCHGTKCAGEVAAEAGNNVCGVGVAFNCSIGGIRMLDGNVTDTIEGSALSFKRDFIDIYSCAWGPKDDGKRFGRPGTLANKALQLGAKEGRQGRGSIFVWATGNGGLTDDDCNCDGYTTSVYTISVGAISDHGLSTYYTESCASTLAVTYSGGSHREKKENKIVTTTLNHKCTEEFRGTSSAAPLAAGMIGLMLEANTNLTWRDVQHVIVETSIMTSPLDEGWRRNGAGKWFNQKFGFGRMDASAMVEKAEGWSTVSDLRTCWSDKSAGPWSIPSAGTVLVALNTTSCSDTASEIKTLEHVQIILSMKHRHRGHISIELISPSGTRTQMLKTRRNDKSTKGLKDWIFMSVHFWGEDPKGVWTLAVTDNSNNNREHHREKSKYGDLEDATEAYQDEVDGKDSGKDSEHEDIVDKTDQFSTSEEFENSVFKDDSYKKQNKKKQKNENDEKDEKIETKKESEKRKARDKNEKIRGSKQLHKQHNHKQTKTKKEQSSEEKAAAKLVEELLNGLKSTDIQKDLESSNANISANEKAFDSQNIQTNVSNDTGNKHDKSLDKSKNNFNETNDENKIVENMLYTVLADVFANSRKTDNDNTKAFEQRLHNLEEILFKNESKPVNETITSILSKALKDGKAIDKINNLLTAIETSKNLSRFQNTTFSKNAGLVSDVLKVLKDVLSATDDDKNTKGYKERISKLLETNSNSTFRGQLFTDLESKTDGKDASSPNVINDALTLIGHILRQKKHKNHKADTLSKDIKILFRDSKGKLLPIQDLVSSSDRSQKEISTTKTTSSKELHHNDNNVETITIEHVNVHKPKGSGQEDDTSTDIFKSDGFKTDKQSDGDSNQEHPTADRKEYSNNGYDEEHFNRDIHQTRKTDDDSGFTIAIMKNGRKIGERKVDNAQARNYLANKEDLHSVLDEKTLAENSPDTKNKREQKPISRSEDNIDIEVFFDKKREDAEESKARQNIVTDFHKVDKNMEFDVLRPNNEEEKLLNVNEWMLPARNDEDLVPSSNNLGKKKNTLEKKVKKKAKMKKNNSKSSKKSSRKRKYEDDNNYMFPFLQFPSQFPQIQMPHGDDTENFLQQIYNPFGPNGLPSFQDLPVLQEQASFHDYTSDFERNSKSYEKEKRSHILSPTMSAKRYNLDNEKGENIISNKLRSSRQRRSVLTENHTDDELNREKRSDIIDDFDSTGSDDEGPHVVKRSAIFSELYPSRKPSLVKSEQRRRTNIATESKTKKLNIKDTTAEKRSAVKKAISLEGTLKHKLRSMRKESSSVLSIMKRVHDDIAVGDSKDLRRLEKQLSTLETKGSVLLTNSENLGHLSKDDKNTLVRTKVSQKPGKFDIKDPDEYYKYGVAASGELIEWTIKFFGTGP